MSSHLPVRAPHLPVLHAPDAERLPAPVVVPLMAGGAIVAGAALAARFGAWLVTEQVRQHRRPL